MNRSSELIYLRDVRDLELARYQLKKRREQLRRRRSRLQQKLAEPVKTPQSSAEVYRERLANTVPLIFFSLYFLFEAAVFIADILMQRPHHFSLYIFLVIGLVLLFIWSFGTYLDGDTVPGFGHKLTEEEIQMMILEPLQSGAPAQDTQEQLERCDAQLRRTEEDMRQVEQILEGYYSMGLLPQEYHNLASVHYIYEYIALLIQPLQLVLSDPQLDDKILRLQAKLDTVIRNQEAEIKERRRGELDRPEVIEQNEAMLMHLSQTSFDSAESVHYAQLSVNYSAAVAFFSRAAYLLEVE